MKVLLATQPSPAAVLMAAIRARAPDLALVEYRSALDDAELATMDALVGWQMPPGLAARLPRVGWICSVAAGVEKLLAPELAPHVRVSRIVDREQAAGIAQFVVMMALRHARELERYEAQAKERVWARQPVPMARHSVAVLGTGAMGGEIAVWLERCGLTVKGWNRRSVESFEAVLGASEIVVCALPLTDETEGILNARAFALMTMPESIMEVLSTVAVRPDSDRVDAPMAAHARSRRRRVGSEMSRTIRRGRVFRRLLTGM